MKFKSNRLMGRSAACFVLLWSIALTALAGQTLSISGVPPANAVEGTAYSFKPTASNSSGTTLTFSISGKPSWASFSTSTGTLSGTPTYGSAATYSGITISVSNGTSTASMPAFSIKVDYAPPTISGTPATTGATGTAYSFKPTASSPDGFTLTFTVSNRPSWMSLNSSTGALSGTPTTAGTYSSIVESVNDGHHNVSMAAFAVAVTQTNYAPTISGTPSAYVLVGQTYSFTPTASDANGDKLTFSISNKPSWASFSTTTGVLSGTVPAGSVSKYTSITISVSDGVNKTSLSAFSITVNPASVTIVRPLGVFAASGPLNSTASSDTQVKGGLVRVGWAQIETSAGSYDFTAITNQVNSLKAAGKKWTLGVVGGPSSPTWLYSSPYNVKSLTLDNGSKIPQYWDVNLQTRLGLLASALAAQFGSDSNLMMVYIPQMSENGIEGQFNHTADSTLTAQGMTSSNWTTAALGAITSFSNAFPDKALAIELHNILSSDAAPLSIIQGIEANSTLLNQAGVAMWWLSGKTTYQAALLADIANFPGSRYGQTIDQSSNTSAFLNSDYTQAYSQAEALGLKYVESWQSDVQSGTWDSIFSSFNSFVSAQ